MTEEIKKLIKSKELVIGTERTIKNLRLGRLRKVFLTSNCPADVKNSVECYSKLSNAEVEQLDIPNDELGVLCKKRFAISVMGLLKSQK